MRRETNFHTSLVVDAVNELHLIEEEVRTITTPAFAQRKLDELEGRAGKARARLGAWQQHLQFLGAEEREKIGRSYHPDLLESALTCHRIDSEIERKRVYKELERTLRRVRAFLLPLLGILGPILNLLGVSVPLGGGFLPRQDSLV